MRQIGSVIRRLLAVAVPLLALESCDNHQTKVVDPGVAGDALPVVISAAIRRPRQTTWSINYWTWAPTFGDAVTGTESLIAPLKPTILRVGGYNNDANTPDPFDHAALDHAVAYAKAIGAEPLIQIPLLADTDGSAPTPASAAAMVTYANVTMAYGVKYFSIGDEPDLYALGGIEGESSAPSIPHYTPAAYCASARADVAQMKRVDPSIKIVGPDLAYQYTSSLDWLTPVLTECGDLFDVISIHRFPFPSAQASLANASGDAAVFENAVATVRQLMDKAGYGNKPLALTEMNIAYDSKAPGNEQPAVPGTVPAALWLADILGSAVQLNLWTSTVWTISDVDQWSMGLLGLPPTHTPRPSYYAYALYAEYFGPTLVDVTSEPSGIRCYATRNQADNGSQVIVINWNSDPTVLSFEVTGLSSTPAPPVFTIPALSLAAVEIPDVGTADAVTYGEAQHQAASGPVVLLPER